ncbi:acetolactate synthase I/II/III large subunit [Candidatus Gastranaerophilus sp. (ex Termes propinquus)]|nr:acetolactate synthase I/II/III large subunit [Candidatus Gastranaerophilus sp. (ex Termes propinquus)]
MEQHEKQQQQQYTGAQIFLKSLVEEGVDEIFGYPGGVILTIYEALYNQTDIKHYLVRHEQAAIHAAEGYARATGRPGVALVTSGPGACNTITGIANAYYDGYPIVVFTGQVALEQIGNDAFQEADIVGITRSCCKHNYLVNNVKDLPRIIKEAFHIATTGKPGPVVIDLPKDILVQKSKFEYPKEVSLAGYNPTYKGHPLQISKALKLLKEAERPVIIAGGGVLNSGAHKELTDLAQRLEVPVTHTLMGAGTYPAECPKYLGMLGMHGNYWANYAVINADVIFALGTRFNDRITGCLKRFARDSQVIHVDIDPCSVGKNVKVDVPIVGDVKNVLDGMLSEIEDKGCSVDSEKRTAWFSQIDAWKQKRAVPVLNSEKLSALTVIEGIYNFTKDLNPIVCTEVGQHQMWTAQLFKFNEPRKLITSGGLGTMGFGFPAAMGACAGKKDSVVLNIAGDGSIQMNIQELATCMDYGFKVINCIINNGYLGMVRQWQEKLFDKHYSQTQISAPDFVKVAEAYGARGIRVTREEEIVPALQEALNFGGPVILDFVVENFEMVYPWVLAGQPLNKVLLSNECQVG